MTAAVGLIAYLQFGNATQALVAAAVPLDRRAADRRLAADRADGPRRAHERRRRLRRAALLRHGLGRLGAAAGVPDHGDGQDRVRRDRPPEAGGAADGRLRMDDAYARLGAILPALSRLRRRAARLAGCATLPAGTRRAEGRIDGARAAGNHDARQALRRAREGASRAVRISPPRRRHRQLRAAHADRGEGRAHARRPVLPAAAGRHRASSCSARCSTAADRGVRVRLLLDDALGIDGGSMIRPLAAHPNIEIRIFNPFVVRQELAVLRGVEFLLAGRPPQLPDAQQALHRRQRDRRHRRAQHRRRVLPGEHGARVRRLRPRGRRPDGAASCRRASISTGTIGSRSRSRRCRSASRPPQISTPAARRSPRTSEKMASSEYLRSLAKSDLLARHRCRESVPLVWAKASLAYDTPDKASTVERTTSRGG